MTHGNKRQDNSVNIIVCIKQVPPYNQCQLNDKNNTLVREGVNGYINPLDLHALEEALRIKEALGKGTVKTISMGVQSTAELLRKTISLGADEGILINDKCFVGSDTLATAYTLSQALKKIKEYDLIICGKQSIDGDTAQVGPSLAEKLTIPHVTNVVKIEEIGREQIVCRRVIDLGYELIEVQLPAVLTVGKDINIPRAASLKDVMKAAKASIQVWKADDIAVDKRFCGISGSPTKVIKISKPTYDTHCEIIEGNLQQQVTTLVDKIMPSP